MALHLQGLLLETTMIIPNKKMQKHEEQSVGNKLHYLAMMKQPAMIQQKCWNTLPMAACASVIWEQILTAINCTIAAESKMKGCWFV